MRTGAVLALDLSQNTGWACGLPGATPRTGTWRLPLYAVEEGRCLAALENEFLDALAMHGPAEVLVEAPLPPQASRNALSCQQAYEMNGIIRAACYRHSVKLSFDHLMTVRKAIIGRANGLQKDDIVAWCRRQGWTVPDHNAADAAILWAYGARRAAGRVAA